mmetsp:Transcript_10293/g.31824  ORF Transcript_10293/g.31824 Transcript_10293/m.31824 type:complete len:253 (-) Transcript_10293:18-776(-)
MRLLRDLKELGRVGGFVIATLLPPHHLQRRTQRCSSRLRQERDVQRSEQEWEYPRRYGHESQSGFRVRMTDVANRQRSLGALCFDRVHRRLSLRCVLRIQSDVQGVGRCLNLCVPVVQVDGGELVGPCSDFFPRGRAPRWQSEVVQDHADSCDPRNGLHCDPADARHVWALFLFVIATLLPVIAFLVISLVILFRRRGRSEQARWQRHPPQRRERSWNRWPRKERSPESRRQCSKFGYHPAVYDASTHHPAQ